MSSIGRPGWIARVARFLVASPPAQDLLPRANYLFVCAMMASELRQPSLRRAHASRIKACRAPLGRGPLSPLPR
jgi:hypothetical protein